MLWITDIYGFMVAGALITMGTLGDRLGHRRILLAGAIAFTGASIFAAYADSAGMLIAARAIQGVAAASLAPSSLSVIRNLFRDPAQRTLAITIWMMSFMGGGALGPLVGGVLLQYFWWGSVFLVAVPTMLVLVLTVPFLVPEFRPAGSGRIDLVSVAMSLVTPLAVVYGIKSLAADGVGPSSLGAIAAGVVVGVLFVRRQRRLDSPLLDLSLFRIPAFAVPAGGMIVVGMLLFGTSLLTSQYLQLVLGFEPLEAGLWQLPTAVGGTVVALWVSGLAARFQPAVLMSAGAALAVLGPIMLTQVDGAPASWWPARCSSSPVSPPSWPWAPAWSSAPHRPNGPVPPRPSPRRARSWAVRWALPPWAASPPPSTAATWRTGCPTAYRRSSRDAPVRRCPPPWRPRSSYPGR